MTLFRKNYLFILIFVLLVDFIFSNLIFKNTSFWKIELNQKKPWRVASNNYHHDLLPLINVEELWGTNKQNLITNSLGFRDSSNRYIKKKNSKKRVLLVGDSFIEGLGYDYEFTLSGLLQKFYNEEYEILNSAVSSYSPAIYYFKTKFLIDAGYSFNKTIIFLDVSDIIDENFLQFNSDGTFKISKDAKASNRLSFKEFFYISGNFLKENFVIFKLISILSDKSEILKNYFKDKYKSSLMFKKNFFKINNNELNLYRMINVDRGNWTKNTDLHLDAKKGIDSSKKYLSMMFDLLKKNNIEITLIIYPWPAQIFYNDFHHEKTWEKFAMDEHVQFLNLYYLFEKHNKSSTIFNNFILGDVHWNKKGTNEIFNAIVKSGIL